MNIWYAINSFWFEIKADITVHLAPSLKALLALNKTATIPDLKSITTNILMDLQKEVKYVPGASSMVGADTSAIPKV